MIILYQGYVHCFSFLLFVSYDNPPPRGQKKKKSCAFYLIYQLLFTTFHLENFNMSEANNLVSDCHIVPCFPNDRWTHSNFVCPFPQFNNHFVDTANVYSSLITGSYGQLQEYSIQGSSTEVDQATGAHNTGYDAAHNKGRWKNRLVSFLANLRC